MSEMTARLNLGDAELDADHTRLETLIGQLSDAPTEVVTLAMEALREHAYRHFEMEDSVLRTTGEGNALCHIEEHAAVLKSLDEVRHRLSEDGMTNEAKSLLVRRLAAHLLDWLPRHVQEMDASIASHRSRQRFGGSPVAFVGRPKPANATARDE
ncbi:MAG: hemerythrin domain-containing protein [Ramlibacter sp.]